MPTPTDPTKKPDAKDDTSSPAAESQALNIPIEPKKSKYTRRNRRPLHPDFRYPYVNNPSDSGEGSEFEDEEGTTYVREKRLGAGSSASGRLFREKNNVGSKKVVILRPVGEGRFNPEMEEVLIKLNFFRTLYPDHDIRLIRDLVIDAQGHKTYRLILPHLPGVMYTKFDPKKMTEQQKIKVSLSAINALEDCHAKNLIVVDLKADNIHYDAKTNKSYLIDGGISKPISANLDPTIFLISAEKIKAYQKHFTHIAPECWTSYKEIEEIATATMEKATAAMDIYSLGNMLSLYLEPAPKSTLKILVDRCLNQEPTKRPSLAELKATLLPLLPPEEAKLFDQPLEAKPAEGEKSPSEVSTETSSVPIAIVTSMTMQGGKISPPTSNANPVIQQAKSFLAAIQALTACHEKQLIVLDLERDRMRYDANAEAYSIDSQNATKRGEKLNPTVYCLQSPEAVREAQEKMPHIAPECWSSDEELDVLATEAMDIYSLGIMLKRTLVPEPGSLMSELIDACIHPEPTQRPPLVALIIPLTLLASGIGSEEVRAMIENGPVQQSRTPESEAGSEVVEEITYNKDDEEEDSTPKPT